MDVVLRVLARRAARKFESGEYGWAKGVYHEGHKHCMVGGVEQATADLGFPIFEQDRIYCYFESLYQDIFYKAPTSVNDNASGVEEVVDELRRVACLL